jgi:hypothetical protein
VVLFHDTFTTYNVPEIGARRSRCSKPRVMVELVVKRVCCGRPRSARACSIGAALAHNVKLLAPYAEQGIPIVGFGFSCIQRSVTRADGSRATRAKLVGQGRCC